MRKHVMVRVGGGWDTLERYFDKHDPCKIPGESRPKLANISKRSDDALFCFYSRTRLLGTLFLQSFNLSG